MKYILAVLILFIASQSLFAVVVVLTEKPVAEFTLPDGKVLKNAYVWRRNSQGLMILHDDGNHFLNFSLLPDDWKAAYLGASETETEAEAGAATGDEAESVVMLDRYDAALVLSKIPELDAAARTLLLSEKGIKTMDEQLLSLSLLQSILLMDRDEAKRFLLILEEKKYEMATTARGTLYTPCKGCSGDGRVDKSCKGCGGLGKCDRCSGMGTREEGIGTSRVHCTTCRGTGKCAKCNGVGKFAPTCAKCRGLGKVVHRQYCQIKLDQLVREVNATALPGKHNAVTMGATPGIDQVLKEWTGLTPPALAYYLSTDYDGGMDTNIVVACLLQSVMKERSDEAAYYDTMIRVLYPDDEVLEVGKYLKFCTSCKGTGLRERNCKRCEGSGKCARCEGSGKRKLEIGDDELHCTACRGGGKCGNCKGDGLLKSVCQVCEGKGRVLEKQRTEIKLGLLADELNDYYNAR